MSDTDDSTDSTASGDDAADFSRREVLSKSSGAGGVLFFGSWWGDGWGSGESDRSGSRGFGGWWDRDRDEDDAGDGDTEAQRPVIFVHGGSGSALEFESQAMRFTSNGYPDDYLAAFEYDSRSYISGGLGSLLGDGSNVVDQVNTALDEKIDQLLADTGEDQVYAMGHSLGTQVLGSYLEDDASAAKVAKYVDLDGRAHDSLPGGVETLAVWGMGSTDSNISGAENVHFDEKSHVQVATSQDTFAEVYEFLLGEAPETTSIEAEPADEITLSGRTQLFPANEVPADLFEGVTLEVYEVDPSTGLPNSDEPVAVPDVDSEGRWGPIDVDGSAHHEFRLNFTTVEQTHHLYRGPELRSNEFVRLHTSRPGEGTDEYVDRSADHSVMTVLRPKEWWGDQAGNSDSLTVDGTNVITEATAPQGQRVISPFIFDAGADGETNLDTQPEPFPTIPFLGGVDKYVPAASPPDDTIDLVETPRNGADLDRSFAVPNWASTDHRISVYVPDHTQTR